MFRRSLLAMATAAALAPSAHAADRETDTVRLTWGFGGLPVIVKDGKAVLKNGGALAGSALRFNEGLHHVASLTGLPLHQLVQATSWNQAQSLGLPHFGKLEPGFFADIAILNPDFSVHLTLVGGEIR